MCHMQILNRRNHIKCLYIAFYIAQSHSTLWSEELATDVNQKGKSILLQEGVLRKLIRVGRN